MDYTNGLISVARSYPSANQPVETRYAYTSNGLLAAVTNANGHWTVNHYESYGYPTQTMSEIGLYSWMTWDSLGHLKEIRLPSSTMVPRVTTFEPNELGWVSKITRPDGQYETFAFDGIGNVTNHVDVAGRTNIFTWLPTRKLASTTRFLVNGTSNQAVTVGMDYDQQMNVVKVSDELGRAVEAYQLDLQDRPTKVTNVESQEGNRGQPLK
jgi:uncharacterized protein RhaS with RHS repeats